MNAKYDNGQLNNKQMQCIFYLLQGKTYTEISKLIGVSRQTISVWRSNEVFNDKYKELMNKQLEELASEALNIMADLMRNSKNDTVKLNACKDFLSRAGYDATSKTELTTPQDISIVITND